MAAGEPGAMARVRHWVLGNFATSWFLLAPLLAAYAPRRLFLTYFNLFLRRHARRLLTVVDPYLTLDISEKPSSDSSSYYYSRYESETKRDTTFDEVKAYLSGACAGDARELRAEGAEEGDGLVISMREGQDVSDEFQGATLFWSSVPADDADLQEHHGGQGAHQGRRRRCQRLTFHQRHRRLVVDEYLPHVRRRGREILFNNRRRRLYTNNRINSYSSMDEDAWSYVDFDHPTTFDTLAMDPAKKKEIMDDLDAFRNNRDLYRRTGKPWKRGYLLHGPPGTGKSTMIAAMANHLNYDIYDVELTIIETNNDLRKLLIQTTGKSIIVIEDIDCSLDLTGDRRRANKDRNKRRSSSYSSDDSKVTLSGLLNFVDGLWSACGGERIVVFTTNHVDTLDPALIRRGRMDMHIEMSYCGFQAFKTLAKNYLGVELHRMFADVEEQLREVDVTPADVAECLMTAKRSGYGEDASLECLIDELKKKKAEAAAAAAEAQADQQDQDDHDSDEDSEGSDEYSEESEE
ncbi:hypothetical protein PR202_gb26250 [Eleusine coracana subsp. coracana]|uniref:AAA+ ATPase domain-containing protein n=1 Tax=Eleusine coracana subsp. coracana TaxID=191504 RepID=A0AAV5FRC8_ELECO|nr:hypothetical protein QOZ80_1BG0060480 [Eleusine coracana subsp. coracana]GJN37312.1 hypothetical protein PR202_gb26250 [Eleusine coracana subsp. coracana]